MKIKCITCKEEEELNEEDIQEVSSLVKKHQLKAVDYLRLLSILRSKCQNNKSHVYVFDDSFTDSIKEIVSQYKKSETDQKKLIEQEEITKKTIIELEEKLAKLRDQQVMIEHDTKLKIKIQDTALDNIEKLTGIKDVNMWS